MPTTHSPRWSRPTVDVMPLGEHWHLENYSFACAALRASRPSFSNTAAWGHVLEIGWPCHSKPCVCLHRVRLDHPQRSLVFDGQLHPRLGAFDLEHSECRRALRTRRASAVAAVQYQSNKDGLSGGGECAGTSDGLDQIPTMKLRRWTSRPSYGAARIRLALGAGTLSASAEVFVRPDGARFPHPRPLPGMTTPNTGLP